MAGSGVPPPLLAGLPSILGVSISKTRCISGGDINEARLVETARGNYFLKFNSLPWAANMFATETEGLALLRSAGARVPEVVAQGSFDGHSYLVMEFISSGTEASDFWSAFGTALARQHAIPQPYFGLSFDNFIGSLPQPNGRFETFLELFIRQRLQYQIDIALQQGRLDSGDARRFEKLYQLLPRLVPVEPPALIHGDLWSGNYLTGPDGLAVLIDPAAAYAHREMDLAMSRLFGGFAPRFYEAYHAALPLEPGFAERMEVYQLYYLLVHVNLFGGAYRQSVRRILDRFVG